MSDNTNHKTHPSSAWDNQFWQRTYTGLTALLLAGCVSTSGNVPVSEAGKTSTPGAAAPAAKTESPRPTAPTVAPPRSSGAQTLLAQANRAIAEQRPNTAVVLLERAIRIEPREAALWIKLSQVHLSKNETLIAFQHARKAVALAGSDLEKSAAAWLQLAEVYQAQGKTSEANQIRQRYRRGRG